MQKPYWKCEKSIVIFYIEGCNPEYNEKLGGNGY